MSARIGSGLGSGAREVILDTEFHLLETLGQVVDDLLLHRSRRRRASSRHFEELMLHTESSCV